MFDFVWNLNENEFENFKEKQRTYKESNYDGGWIGNVRCGLYWKEMLKSEMIS